MGIFRHPIRELVGFNDLWLRLIGIPVIAFMIPMIFYQVFPGHEAFLAHFLTGLFFTTIYWHTDWLIITFFRDRYPEFKHYRKRLLLQAFFVTVFTLSFCNLTELVFWLFGTDLSNPYKPSVVQLNFSSMVITLTVSSIYEAVYGIHMWKRSLIESEKLKKANLQAQLETLKNQVNPHFLFNSLNTLTSIIPEEPERAVEFVQKLSYVYRYILEIKNKELITLREEMDCIESYRFLLQMRFGDNVQFETDIPETLMDKHIVPLSAQILLENAIKHNVISTNKPLRIQMHIGPSGNLLVSNNLQKKPTVNGSTKTGLTNIKNRYKILTDQEVEVIVTRDHFTVSLPLLQLEES